MALSLLLVACGSIQPDPSSPPADPAPTGPAPTDPPQMSESITDGVHISDEYRFANAFGVTPTDLAFHSLDPNVGDCGGRGYARYRARAMVSAATMSSGRSIQSADLSAM